MQQVIILSVKEIKENTAIVQSAYICSYDVCMNPKVMSKPYQSSICNDQLRLRERIIWDYSLIGYT